MVASIPLSPGLSSSKVGLFLTSLAKTGINRMKRTAQGDQKPQCDQIGRIFTHRMIVYFVLFFGIDKNSAHFGVTLSHS
jgi:hypothetical protein